MVLSRILVLELGKTCGRQGRWNSGQRMVRIHRGDGHVVDQSHSDPKVRAASILARAASPSPAQIDAHIVAACREGQLTAPAIVGLVSWISVLQMLHRLSSYYVVP